MLSGVDALGRLLSQRAERAAYREDPAAWLATQEVEPSEREWLGALDPGELEVQAGVLLDKRAGEVAERIPRTRSALGERYPELFQSYVEDAPWPEGHLRHLHDARAFLRWLRAREPLALADPDHWAVESELDRRQGRRPLRLALGHHADSWTSTLQLWVRLGAGRGRLVFPLPWPSAWGRRWAWERAGAAARAAAPRRTPELG